MLKISRALHIESQKKNWQSQKKKKLAKNWLTKKLRQKKKIGKCQKKKNWQKNWQRKISQKKIGKTEKKKKTGKKLASKFSQLPYFRSGGVVKDYVRLREEGGGQNRKKKNIT